MNDYLIQNFNRMAPDEICEYLSVRHHTYIREALGSIRDHLAVALTVDIKISPQLTEVRRLFIRLSESLDQHFNAEENILFPFIEGLVKAYNNDRNRKERIPANLLDHPLSVMNRDHKYIRELVGEIRELTHQYKPEINNSPTLKLCYLEFHDLEEDLNKQFFLEENILTVKLITLEEELVARPQR